MCWNAQVHWSKCRSSILKGGFNDCLDVARRRNPLGAHWIDWIHPALESTRRCESFGMASLALCRKSVGRMRRGRYWHCCRSCAIHRRSWTTAHFPAQKLLLVVPGLSGAVGWLRSQTGPIRWKDFDALRKHHDLHDAVFCGIALVCLSLQHKISVETFKALHLNGSAWNLSWPSRLSWWSFPVQIQVHGYRDRIYYCATIYEWDILPLSPWCRARFSELTEQFTC